MKYSIFSLLKNTLSGHKNWPPAWREPQPKKDYDVIIIGGGGHGLATAYYLAKLHGINNVAVLEKSWLGSGNVGRNTTIIRSNYLLPGNNPFYEWSLKLWEGLEQDFNFNAMVSQRGVLNLCHSDSQYDAFARRGNAMHIDGLDAELLDREGVREMYPFLDFNSARFPIRGGMLQRRGGTVRHDAVAWGYARGADSRGVDIIQNCEVTGFIKDGNRVVGVKTNRGTINTEKVGLCAAGHSSVLAEMAGFRLPIQSHPLQALVSELHEPVHPTVVMSNHVHVYVSQAHKGELVMGAGVDSYNGYGQRGSFHVIEHQMAAAVELFPIFARAHVLRTWGGIVDTTLDASPIVGNTPVENMFVNCGWGTGGFKGTPAAGLTFAHNIATGTPHELNKPFALERFETGALIDEHGAAAVAH
jgi:sarcosine oxidase, subunit beta